MDGETIVYIIIGIIYFIVSALTSSKKKKEKRLADQQRKAQQGQPSRQESSERPEPAPVLEKELTLEDIMGKLMGEDAIENRPQPEIDPDLAPQAQALKRERESARLETKARQEAETKMRARQQASVDMAQAKKRAFATASVKIKESKSIKKRAFLYKKVSAKDALISSFILDRPYK